MLVSHLLCCVLCVVCCVLCVVCCVCVVWYVVSVVHYSHRRLRWQDGVAQQQLTRGRLLRLLPPVRHHQRQVRAQRLWAALVLGAWGV